jgi:hypothetical protein
MKFSIGDKVIEKKLVQAHTSYPVNKVVGFLDRDLLVEGWGFGFKDELTEDDYESPRGSRGWRSGIVRYSEDELFTPEEVVSELRRLEETNSKLEEEFNAVRELIAKNMGDAARLVKQAGDLVKPTGKDFYDLTIECKDLYLALKDGGWSHSTMSCKYGR